jgi:hypothetical protein
MLCHAMCPGLRPGRKTFIANGQACRLPSAEDLNVTMQWLAGAERSIGSLQRRLELQGRRKPLFFARLDASASV